MKNNMLCPVTIGGCKYQVTDKFARYLKQLVDDFITDNKRVQRILDEDAEFSLSLDDQKFDPMEEVPEGCGPEDNDDPSIGRCPNR